MLAYKILFSDEEGLFSMLRRHRIKYGPRKINVPDFGKLFVFDRLKHAYKYFIELKPHTGLSSHKLFLVEVENAEPIKRVGFINTDYKQFWKENLDKYKTMATPHGTMVCDSVKLIKEIKI